MDISEDDLRRYVPYYFTKGRADRLISALRDPPSRRYYHSQVDREPLQGDGWQRLQLFRFDDGKRDFVHGLILTNSCDLAAANTRMLPAKLNFVPLIEFQKYLSLLASNGISAERIQQHAKDVRAQSVSEIFFLPQDMLAGPERIAYLRDVHTMPVAALVSDGNARRILSLSDVGFYLFVVKLSIHFCRLHEEVDRGSPT